MRVAVIGAGPVGLAAAHGFIRLGAEVTAFEAGPAARQQGSGLSLFGNGVAALESLGLGPALHRLTGDRPPRFGGIRAPDGRWLARTPRSALSTMRVVHREDLHAALLEALPPGTVRFDTAAELSSAQDGLVTCGHEAAVEADLVVVADGIRSRSRRAVTTDPGTRSAGYGAWRGVTRDPLDGVVPSETWGAGLRFGLVPLTDGRVYWFGVSNTAGVGTGDHRQQVLDTFGDWHEPIADVVRATEADTVSWLPIEELARPLSRLTRGRAVLVGDAAHAMTPNLGQGANQGFEDVAALCALLGTSPGQSVALERYDSLRRHRTARVARQSRTIGHVGQLSHPLLVRVRDTLIRMTPDHVAGHQFQQFDTWSPPAAPAPATPFPQH